jgi:hypothetical protein
LFGAVRIVLGIHVLAAVSLHDHPALEAREIGNERAKRVLAAEFEPAQPTVAQPGPEQALGFRRFAAHGLRLEVGHGRKVDART